MANFVSYANAQSLITAIAQKFNAVEGAYVFKGSATLATLPDTLTATMVGYVYNMSEEFTIDNRFVEYQSGVTKKYPAGTNVAICDVGTASTPDLKFDILAGFIDVDAIYNAIADVSAMIADEFLATENYTTGDLVTKDGVLYKFIADHDAGAWDDSETDEVTVEGLIADIVAAADGLKAKVDATQADIAPIFDATSGTYAVGDLVIYNNQLYKFNTAHSVAGAWVAAEADAIDIDTIVKALKLADTNLGLRVDQVRSDLAPTFDATQAYSVGNVVTYTDDKLYKFTAAHAAGAWTGEDVTETTVAGLIDVAEPDPLTTEQVEALITLLD